MSEKSPLKVGLGIAGVGVVGAGLVAIISERLGFVRHSQAEISIAMVSVRDRLKQRKCDLEGIAITTDALDLVANPEVDVVIELMGGVDHSFALVAQALQAGKPVVTANKALLAERGDELFELAKSNQVPLLFEAAVAGAIPIIKVLREAMTANKISQVAGIMNGTCNYILTHMEQQKIGYEKVLAKAQELGYAESDPSFDVEGIDAAHKLALLGRLVFLQQIPFEQIYHQGLKHVQLVDIGQAKRLGYTIKPLAIAKHKANQHRIGQIEMQVQPHLVSKQSLVAHINGVLNIIELVADKAGITTYSGAGAGAEATASAVMADVIEIVRSLEGNCVQSVYMPEPNQGRACLTPIDEMVCPHYMRLHAVDKPGALRALTEVLDDYQISIESIHQQEPAVGDEWAMIVLITSATSFHNIKQVIERVLQSPLFDSQHCLIPVYQS